MDRWALIRWLWGFQAWANDRLLAAATSTPPHELNAPNAVSGGLGTGSIHDMLAHVVGAEEIWLRRWQGDPDAPLPGGSDFADVHAIVARWRSVDRDRFVLLDSLTDGDLDVPVEYVSVTRRVGERLPLWETMLHITNHTTHHRAEACTALTALGSPPESVDLIDYLRASLEQGLHG
jgi:uncharacterized damage-inducible protein DinB